MKKRVLAAVSALIMAFACMTACGNSSSTAETSKTESSSATDSSSSVSESTADSDSKTETTTTETTTTTTTSSANDSSKATPSDGKYTYTVYGDIQLTMDVNIDDYIFTNDSGKKVFRFFDLAVDLGWYPSIGGGLLVDPSTYGKTIKGWGDTYNTFPQHYYWKTDSGYTQIEFDYMQEKDPKQSNAQLGYLGICVVKSKDNAKVISTLHPSKHFDDNEYVATNYLNIAASRNDIIIYAYLFSTIPKNPDKDPFAGTSLEKYGKKDYRLP